VRDSATAETSGDKFEDMRGKRTNWSGDRASVQRQKPHGQVVLLRVKLVGVVGDVVVRVTVESYRDIYWDILCVGLLCMIVVVRSVYRWPLVLTSIELTEAWCRLVTRCHVK